MAETTTLGAVTSADGTPIAFERSGSGPPLVLVHGMAGDHTRWEINDVRSSLAEHNTVYAIDRRGRGGSGDVQETPSAEPTRTGGSGDAAGYALEREYEDVAAVVDSIDEPVNVLGHSHGALCALEAALLTDNLRSLVLYEPPIPWEIVGPGLSSEETVSEMETLLAEGDAERALVVFMRDLLKLPPEQLDALRSDPSWRARVDATHTIPREERATRDYEWVQSRFEGMSTPTLLLLGGESPDWARDATEALHEALPNSRISVLEGQGHVAMNTAPEQFVDEVLAFLRESY